MKSIIIILKTIIAHIIIFVITLTILFLFSLFNISNDFAYVIFFISVLMLYFFSGYFLVNPLKIKWYQYSGIAIIGTIIWGIAFAVSPDYLNYKRVDSAGIWLFYHMYISGIETPLNFIESKKILSIKSEMFFILMLPIVASLMQYLGALLKTKIR
jgi:hypothetical protein